MAAKSPDLYENELLFTLYMRQVWRDEYPPKERRANTNERRRIDCWLTPQPLSGERGTPC